MGSPLEKLFRSALDYDPATGLFRWKVLSGKARPGAIAGSKHCAGYISLRYKGNPILAHRLAWLFVHSEMPQHEIDHINGDRTDNRIANLRDVPRSINNENLRKARSHNRSGLLGVNKRVTCNSFRSVIRVNGRRFYLGSFGSADEAHQAYLTAKRCLHKGNTL